jgi:uracil-DNA glycosylase family 4
MEKRYRTELDSLKTSKIGPNSFAQELFNGAGVPFYSELKISFIEADNEPLPDQTANKVNSDPIKTPEVASEKSVVMDSLKNFADKKVGDTNNSVHNFNGGNLARKFAIPENYSALISDKVELLKGDEFALAMQERFTTTIIEQRYEKHDRLSSSDTVEIIFVTDAYLCDDADTEMDLFFNNETAQLFSRMIGAMKLQPKEYLVSALSKDSDDESSDIFESFLEEIVFFKPKIIMTLGASAAHKLLGIKDRLSKIHGQSFEKTVTTTDKEDLNFTIVPIFHPEFLLINPAMKKTAWEDMQVIMQTLGKL